jgi:ubiquinone/menaquinone biosynthesis C-methylase UbiE
MSTQPVRFNHIFDQWAKAYDDTVYSEKGEYHEVFFRYEEILRRTAELVEGQPGDLVVDVGAGTGNLSAAVRDAGYRVLAVEPNVSMREQGQAKHPEIPFLEGNFLDLPEMEEPVRGVVCSYAFHHLTDEEKREAARRFYDLLDENGTVVIADTMYASAEEGQAILADAVQRGYHALADDLRREFYTTHAVLREAFEAAGFTVSFERLNKFVWILQARKG